MSAVGSRVSEYREYTGTRRRASRACADSIMLSWRSARKPCCGPNTAARVTPGAVARRSTMWRNAPSIEAGLATTPTRRPRSRPDSSRKI